MSGEGILPNDPADPRPVLIDLENGTALQFTGPAAQLLRRAPYSDVSPSTQQENGFNE